jgi:ribose transport system permease protein
MNEQPGQPASNEKAASTQSTASAGEDSAAGPATGGGGRPSRAPLLARIPPELVLVVFLAVMVGFFSIRSPFFLEFSNFRNILLSVAVLGVLAVPSTLLLVSANVDLSVASNAALCGMILALVSQSQGSTAGAMAALAVGLIAGAINGFLVAYVGINAIITTLGTLSVFRGIARLSSNGQTEMVSGFTVLGSDTTLAIPNAVIVLAVVAVVFYFLMRYSVFGRSVYAIGSNPQAARLSGIGLRRNLFTAFAVTGLLAAVAGLILTSQLRAASPIAGLGLELSVVAAVLLGGASLDGGRGTVIGTILGVLILGTLTNGLTILGISSFWQEIANGVVLIVAVGLDQLRLRFRRD